MAIIKYTLNSGTTPSYISDGGYFVHPTDRTYVGVGSGGGTELSKTELKTYAKTLPDVWYLGFDSSGLNVTTSRAYTDAELESLVDEWCSNRGIS